MSQSVLYLLNDAAILQAQYTLTKKRLLELKHNIETANLSASQLKKTEEEIKRIAKVFNKLAKELIERVAPRG